MISGSTTIKCTCSHEYQDTRYGEGIRVASATAKQDVKNDRVDVRCTVCSKVKTITVGQFKNGYGKRN
jgi:hypothetical protein